MKIIYLKEVDSTQKYLKSYIDKYGYNGDLLVYTTKQNDGIGSRNNKWLGKEGNLFFSFIVKNKFYVKLESLSIFFATILKIKLKEKNSKILIKWPNDLYIDKLKVGGIITSISNNYIICGIGLNLVETNPFGHLDIKLDIYDFLKEYSNSLYKYSWDEVFKYYKEDFNKTKDYLATIENNKISLKDAKLNYDGSIEINGKKYYSLR